MKRGGLVIVIVIVIVSGLFGLFVHQSLAENSSSSSTTQAGALTREELASQIQIKAKQLEDISQQLELTKQNLKNTKGERVTLQKELNTLQGNINQLSLNIKADEITIQKLGLEIDSLNFDLVDIQESTKDKRSAIENILRELQKNDHVNSNLFILFLRSGSLAEGALEAQTLNNLQNQLTLDVANLRVLQDEYNKKIGDVSSRKGDISFRRQNLTNRKLIVEDQKDERQTLLAQTKNRESEFQKQAKELEKLQAEVSAEIEKIEAELRKNIDPNLLPIARPGVLLWPVPNPRITQGYGSTQFALANYRSKYHNGLDFGAPLGTEVFAAENGKVINIGDQDKFCRGGAYGKFVVIKHGNGLTTLYGHLSKYIAGMGQLVKRGETIGYIGRTGRATGPHLHFTVFANNTLTPARPGFPEGTMPSRVCGPTPVGGNINPTQYL